MHNLVNMWLWLVAGAYLLSDLLTLRAHALVPDLPAAAPDDAPLLRSQRVGVVVAARNEADRIGDTVQALAEQQGAELRVVVVDDRSQDATSDAAQRAIDRAGAADRMRVLRVEHLPQGWLGKCHALRRGAEALLRDEAVTRLLFMDADCVLTRHDAVARALACAQRLEADHLALIPALTARSFLGKSALLALMVPLIRRCAAVNADRPRATMGVGAFNLVDRRLYESFQGHHPLRLEVLDDVHLGSLVKRAGGRSRVRFAVDCARVDYAASIPDMFRALEKNAFAALRYNLPAATALLSLLALVWTSGVFGFLTLRPAGFAATAACASTIVPALVAAKRLRWSAAPALLAPYVVPLVLLAFAGSIVRTLRDGGVRWRETFYPLAELRRGMLQRASSPLHSPVAAHGQGPAPNQPERRR